MATLFSRLQFNEAAAGDQLKENSPEVNKHLQAMPPMLPEWAQTDMVNQSVGGYYKNPVQDVTTRLVTYCQNIMNVGGVTETPNTSIVYAAANNLVNYAPTYIAHTNRISGVSAINQNTTTLPHLDTAINTGKMLTVLMYQVDGIETNAPMIGSFTSLYTVDLFNTRANTIITYASEVRNSINVESYTDEMGTTYTTYSSNLTSGRANTMAALINGVVTEMSSRKTGDETFYTNAQVIISEYSALKKFNNMGATESDMFNNLVGTDKLKTRLNS